MVDVVLNKKKLLIVKDSAPDYMDADIFWTRFIDQRTLVYCRKELFAGVDKSCFLPHEIIQQNHRHCYVGAHCIWQKDNDDHYVVELVSEIPADVSMANKNRRSLENLEDGQIQETVERFAYELCDLIRILSIPSSPSIAQLPEPTKPKPQTLLQRVVAKFHR